MAKRWRPAAPSAFALVQACQVAVNEFMPSRHWPDLRRVEALLQSVPNPKTYGDALEASIVLHRFIQRAAVGIHQLLHAGDDGERLCEFNPTHYERLAAVDSAHPERWTANLEFQAWAAVYTTALRTHHPGALSERAIERLRNCTGTPVRVSALAKDLGCSVSVLRRQFAKVRGESVRRLGIRFRACAAFDLLRTTEWKVEAIARQAGWKSRKNLNLALWRLAQTTPAHVRALDDSSATAVRNVLAGVIHPARPTRRVIPRAPN